MTTTLDLQTRRALALQKIADYLTRRGVPAQAITDDARWTADLGIDSLDILVLVQELEDDFGLEMRDDDVYTLTTVGLAADFVAAGMSGVVA